jgi:hypothetical protein
MFSPDRHQRILLTLRLKGTRPDIPRVDAVAHRGLQAWL